MTDEYQRWNMINKAYCQLAIAVIKTAVDDGDYNWFDSNQLSDVCIQLANRVTAFPKDRLREYTKLQHDKLLMETVDIFNMG